MQESLAIRTANNNSSTSDVASTVDCGDNHGHSFEEYGPKLMEGGFGLVCKIRCSSCLSVSFLYTLVPIPN